jgi:hypothetical protein
MRHPPAQHHTAVFDCNNNLPSVVIKQHTNRLVCQQTHRRQTIFQPVTSLDMIDTHGLSGLNLV